jgi:hypothetical protein
MRNVTKLLLTAGLAVAFVSLTIAQPMRPGGGIQVNDTTLLAAKKVQEELKLTDAQKEAITKLNEKRATLMKDVFSDGKFDRDKLAKVNEEMTKATNEFVKDLKPEQAKRLKQISIQATLQFNGPVVFTRENVQTDLSLTDKQKEMIKTTVEDVAKDSKEIRDAAGKDRDAQTKAREKIAALNKEATEKITKGFTESQGKKWKEMQGDKFELTAQDLFTGPMRPGKDKKDKQ